MSDTARRPSLRTYLVLLVVITLAPVLAFSAWLVVRVHGQERAALEREPQLSGLRVVVVDDDPDSLELLATLLRGQDAEVRTAVSAAEALALVEEWKPNLLVADIEMPGEDTATTSFVGSAPCRPRTVVSRPRLPSRAMGASRTASGASRRASIFISPSRWSPPS